VDPRQASSASSVVRKLPAMVSFLEDLYTGPAERVLEPSTR
jgi:hypothetical protein